MATALNGIGGVVDGAASMRTWNAALSDELVAAYASNTLAGPHRVDGNTDWSGNYVGYGSIPNVMPGDTADLKLSLDELIGITGPAIVDQVEIVWDWENKLPIAYTVGFSGNGAVSLGASVVSTDATLAADVILPSTGCKIEIADFDPASPTFVEVEALRTATLTLRAANTQYVDSSTSGTVKRIKGNFDASMSFSVHCLDFSKLAAADLDYGSDWEQGKSNGIKMYTTSTLFWLIHWMNLSNLSDLTLDREGAGIVGMTLNWEFNGFLQIGVTPTATPGYVKTPEASPVTIWPYA